MGAIHWRLRELIQALDISALRVEQEAHRLGYRLGKNAIYRLLRRPPERVAMTTVAALLDALQSLTGASLTVADLMEFAPIQFESNRSLYDR
jgi:Cro/C1-type HTH DNA-binding domain